MKHTVWRSGGDMKLFYKECQQSADSASEEKEAADSGSVSDKP